MDARHFVLLGTEVRGDFEYQTYAARHPGSTILLESPKTPNVPVAAISLTCNQNHLTYSATQTAQSLIVKRTLARTDLNDSNLFQCMTNHVDNDIGFVITNLTDFVTDPYEPISMSKKDHLGYLKIDILTEDIKVIETDYPTKAINQINELRPSESYHVRSDQRTGNYTMNMGGVVDQKTGTAVSVKESEASQDSAKKASKFFVNVVARAKFPDMVKALDGAQWRPVDVFIRKIPKENGTTRPHVTYSTNANTMSFGRGMLGATQSSNVIYKGENEEEDFDDFETVTRMESMADLLDIPLSCDIMACSRGSAAPATHETVKRKKATTKVTSILDSQAANVVSGNTKVTVNSGTTIASYDFDECAPRMTLSFSIWQDMKIHEVDLNLRDELSQGLMEDALYNENKELLEAMTKKFISETCVICLENEPTIILVQCGHQCLCVQCRKELHEGEPTKCYLCRQPVVAMFPVKLIMQ